MPAGSAPVNKTPGCAGSRDKDKAFDNVNHRILIKKLRGLNFSCSSLSWICSYLDHRRQTVRDAATGSLSSETYITGGVSQGSVLGLLLFTLYLNDFGHVLNNCKYILYADDLLIYMHSDPKNLSQAIDKVNEDIDRILLLAGRMELKINPRKTTAMIMGTARITGRMQFQRRAKWKTNHIPRAERKHRRRARTYPACGLARRTAEGQSTSQHSKVKKLAAE